MKRYYISDLIGDGTDDNPFRPAVDDYKVPYAMVSKCDPVTGLPLKNYTLVLVGGNKHSQIQADSRCQALPDFPKDAKISSMHRATKDKMIADMQRRGIPVDFITTADGYREIIRKIGKGIDLAFEEDNMDVSDI